MAIDRKDATELTGVRPPPLVIARDPCQNVRLAFAEGSADVITWA